MIGSDNEIKGLCYFVEHSKESDHVFAINKDPSALKKGNQNMLQHYK